MKKLQETLGIKKEESTEKKEEVKSSLKLAEAISSIKEESSLDERLDLAPIRKIIPKIKIKPSAFGPASGEWLIGSTPKYNIQIKFFDKGSRFGIKGGRIFTLNIRAKGETEDLVNYDRGWDVKPGTPELKTLVDKIVKVFGK